MKRKTIVATSIGAAVVLALGGGYAYSASNNSPLVGVAQATAAPLTVTASASGSLVAAHSAGVYPPTAGTVAKVRVADGDTVKAGDTLAEMATGPLRLAVFQARAALSAARAQGEAVSNGVPSAIDRSAAGAALAAARSQVSTARKNYASFRADYDDATSAERHAMLPTLRTLKTARTQASAALKAAKAALGRLSAASRVSLARTAATQAVTAASRALRLAEDNLDKAALTAPFGGTVTIQGTVEKGSGLSPGVAAFTVIDPTRMEFEAAVNETDIADIAKDESATVTLDAFTEGFAGTVVRVQASPETTSTGSVAYPVRVSLDAGQSRLFQGMSGSVDIAVKSIPDALTVPVEAVLTKGSSTSVFLLGPDNVVHARTVTVGASTDTSAQILTGLTAGDTVVTTGASALSDGQRVRTK
ncbi:MAG TPA: efflux RND transporter periplasmic adaptor subunit [Propionicimonas sp.]|jgi:RND family efflux transporter MFP subunit|uniref:efflux RND transporter periplasmic adaptor subunit n=1 Tax=Propionicimonas sp. TaxID=1955623 RepID=UPI002F3FFC41